MRGDTGGGRVLVSVKTDAHPKELYYICRSESNKAALIAAARHAVKSHESIHGVHVRVVSADVVFIDETKP